VCEVLALWRRFPSYIAGPLTPNRNYADQDSADLPGGIQQAKYTGDQNTGDGIQGRELSGRVLMVDDATRYISMSLCPWFRRFIGTCTGSDDAAVDRDSDFSVSVDDWNVAPTGTAESATGAGTWVRWLKRRIRGAEEPLANSMARETADRAAESGAADNPLAIEMALRELDTVPDELRAVLALVCVQGLSYRETAVVLEIPIGTVMSRLARGRLMLARRIRSSLEQAGGDEPSL
jgi:RNA polymerase sigma-70 factor (ECF subfamily)